MLRAFQAHCHSGNHRFVTRTTCIMYIVLNVRTHTYNTRVYTYMCMFIMCMQWQETGDHVCVAQALGWLHAHLADGGSYSSDSFTSDSFAGDSCFSSAAAAAARASDVLKRCAKSATELGLDSLAATAALNAAAAAAVAPLPPPHEVLLLLLLSILQYFLCLIALVLKCANV
jgi:hypothetical protein